MRLDYIHKARGLAALAIILQHTNTMMNWPQHSAGAPISTALDDVSVCFVFISGFLFQHLSANFEYSKYLKRKLQNVVAPYIIFSIPAILMYLVAHKSHPWLPPEFFDQSPLVTASYFLATGQHLGPFWFMPLMFLFFAAAPAFLWIEKRPALYWLIAPLLVIAYFVHRPAHNDNAFQAFVPFLPAYLIGMAASRWKETLAPIWKRCWAPLLAIVALCFWASAQGWAANAGVHLKLPLCFAMLAIFLRFPDFGGNLLRYIADVSYGVFFVHGYVVAAGRMIEHQYPAMFHATVFAIVPAFVIVVGISVLIVELIRWPSGPLSRSVLGVAPRATKRSPAKPETKNGYAKDGATGRL